MPQPRSSIAPVLLGLTFLGAVWASVPALGEESWPQFRGPDGQGHAPSGKFPARFGESENVISKASLRGRGWSSRVSADGVGWCTTALTREASPARKQEIARTKLVGNPLADEMEIIDSVSLRAAAISLASGKVAKDIELF